MQSGGTRATAGTVYPILGYGCAGCQRLYHSLVPTYILGLVYCHPWPENLGWREQGLGLRSSLGQSQSQGQSQGQGQGQWLTSLSAREMANPRAGSKAKAHSMAIQVTKPVAGASTLAHSTRGSRVLGSSQLNWLCQVHHWRHDWSWCLTQF